MSKHTPGKWIHTYDRGYHVEAESGGNICNIEMSASSTKETEFANARLIASAPEMLEALKEIAESGINPQTSNPAEVMRLAGEFIEKLRTIARVAIERVEGK